jgi:hypothetical protein
MRHKLVHVRGILRFFLGRSLLSIDDIILDRGSKGYEM